MAGGGTGGHVYPALAIAAELAERGAPVSWIGRGESLEETLVGAAGVPFHALAAKPWVGKGPTAKIGAAATLLTSSWRARSLVRGLGADVVLGTGGYVSTPAVLGARLAGVPAFLLEPNAVAGAANRFASRWCSAAFVAHQETARRLACDAVVSGIPVRSSFHEIGPLPSGVPQVLVLGGSQGARQLNEVLPSAIQRLQLDGGVGRFRVVHQTGRAHFASVEAAYMALGLAAAEDLEVVAYIDDMAAQMTKAHLVISRAGALTAAELAAAGRPAVLVPLTAAGAGHQRFNAERMASAGAALVLADEEVTAESLHGAIAGLLGDRPRLEAMAQAARSQASPSAAVEIAAALVRAGGAA
jgi:UDP-N-acetylglucosamine--N-acetylmuramyl-(pentapeptide) pyrophosphoryl-undecaprenol N-acetylglucosamine transferase